MCSEAGFPTVTLGELTISHLSCGICSGVLLLSEDLWILSVFPICSCGWFLEQKSMVWISTFFCPSKWELHVNPGSLLFVVLDGELGRSVTKLYSLWILVASVLQFSRFLTGFLSFYKGTLVSMLFTWCFHGVMWTWIIVVCCLSDVLCFWSRYTCFWSKKCPALWNRYASIEFLLFLLIQAFYCSGIWNVR